MTLRRLFISAALLVAVGAVIVISLRIRQVARFELQSEDRLQATILVCDLVASHVELNGVWPKDWSDLESLPTRKWSRFSWPADAVQVEALVDVDFGYDVHSIVDAKPETFQAVRPRGADFDLESAYGVEPMLERIRAARRGR